MTGVSRPRRPPRTTRRLAVVAGTAATAAVVAPPVAVAWPRTTVDADRVGRTVDDVLRDPAFTASQQNWLSRLRDDVRQWFLERLADIFGSGAGTVLAWGLVALAIVVGAVVVARALRGVRRGGAREHGPPAVRITRRAPLDWLSDARAARQAGDLAEAVRCGYRAVVAALALEGTVEEVPGRTVGEYRAQVAAQRPERGDDFGRASEVFERVWYARRPAREEDVEAVLAVAEATTNTRRHPVAEVGA